ncbi:MAG: LysR family transcriptional regulator [Ectothiorhodospiraceae bacterium]|nr:LysR family transcriptional regulator [Ectothiorhodospiraceae bacterium]
MYEKWLQAFHTVAVAGGFTRAAEVLNVGQPTVSTHVKALEAHFRVELFHRHGRSVKLTPTGERLLTITRDLYGHEAEALALLRATRNLETGRLVLSAVGPFDVMEVLQVFRRRHPGIDTHVTLGFEGEILDGLRCFDHDVGVIGRPVDDPEFHCVFYNRHRVLVIVHVDHPLARRRTVRLADLQGCEMVLRPSFSTTRQAFDRAIEAAGVRINPVMEINSREAAREAVVRGFGIGVISETELAPSPSIRTLRVTDAEMYTRAYLVCLASRSERPLIRAYFETAEGIDPARRGSI